MKIEYSKGCEAFLSRLGYRSKIDVFQLDMTETKVRSADLPPSLKLRRTAVALAEAVRPAVICGVTRQGVWAPCGE